LKAAGWKDAVAFGIGFGAAEAFVLGLLTFVGLLAAIGFWEQIPEDAKASLAAETGYQPGPAVLLLPVAERLSALVVHVLTCVLIVYAVRCNHFRWFWLSFLYKAVVDAFAAWAILATPMTQSVTDLATFETAGGVFAALGLACLALLRTRFRSLPAPELPAPEPDSTEV